MKERPDMKIVKIEDLHCDAGWRVNSFLKITTDEGIVGWSEATMGLQTKPVEAALHELRPLYVGADPLRINELWDSMYKALYLAESSVPVTAMTAIEMTLSPASATVRPTSTAERDMGRERNRSIIPLLRSSASPTPVCVAPKAIVCTKMPGIR